MLNLLMKFTFVDQATIFNIVIWGIKRDTAAIFCDFLLIFHFFMPIHVVDIDEKRHVLFL